MVQKKLSHKSVKYETPADVARECIVTTFSQKNACSTCVLTHKIVIVEISALVVAAIVVNTTILLAATLSAI